MAKRGRSPSYPGIPLQKALELARTVYRKEQDHPAPVQALLSHWDYKPKSGAGLVAVAALKKYGLAADEGAGDDRTVRISQRAIDIIIDERPESPERASLIRDCALAPRFFREAWSEWDGRLPSDENMKFWLRKQHFTENGANDFIRVFRATLEYANLRQDDTIEDGHPDDSTDRLEVGDYVQWEQRGVLQFPEGARQIVGFFDDEHARVEGTSTGILVSELSPAKPRRETPPMLPLTPGEHSQGAMSMINIDAGAFRDLSIPLPGGRMAILRSPARMSDADHDILTKYLDLMKDALVVSGETPGGSVRTGGRSMGPETRDDE